MRPWIVYSLLRFGIFAAVFALLVTFLPLPLESIGVGGFIVYVVAAAGAALISFAVSYIFFWMPESLTVLSCPTGAGVPTPGADFGASLAAANCAR